jgi:hypothetical protein
MQQQLQVLAGKIQQGAQDPTTARELNRDLREIGMGIAGFGQSTQLMLQQMAQYIQGLETQLQSHPQPTLAPRGWMQAPAFGGRGGFFRTMLGGLGLGAGLGIGQDLVNDIFRAL